MATTREIDRFVVGDVVNTGGMGAVHRATDKDSGALVALKLLGRPAKDGQARFFEEARSLSELDHPNIVRYLAHGLTSDGEAFLAMEWLEGEDLADRLTRGPLTTQETLALARAMASALGAAHERHIIHRDVKPSNIFLVDGKAEQAKLIDFGVARRDTRDTRLTATGLSVGTIGYMAPEQARGGQVYASADVFALGCVLFECLTGKAVFEGPPVAVLAKILFYDPPRMRDVMTGAPRDLDELVARMLAKEASERPPNGGAVESALRELRSRPPAALTGPHGALSTREQRIVGIVLGDRSDASLGKTLTPDEIDAELTTARAVVMPFGAEAACSASGAIVVTMTNAKSATDLAARAASVALALRETLPHLDLAIATGRAEVNLASPVGPAIDRAAALLAKRGLPPSAVRIDDVTAGLVEGRFATKLLGDVRVLVGHAEEGSVRTLLGRATACVGREKELTLLEATFEECRTESVSRSVFVSAPAGTGKSRLMRELVTRLTAKHDILVLTARGDPVGAGSALGPIRQLLRAAFPAAGVLAVLARSRLRRTTDSKRADRLTAFLAELAGETVPDVPPELRAARNDPRLMREWQKLAFREWLASECHQQPVMLIFEDIQWGDSASIAFVDDALRALEDRPLFVLTLARPEATESVAEMGPARARQTLSLSALGKRACETIARAALPVSTPPETIARIVDRSDGNAFFLEELVRSVAEGREDWPETVVAMVQMRLETLELPARRFLRAASVFGERFRLGGVAALLGESDPDAAQSLVQSELIEPMRAEPVDREQSLFRFRHGLVRDAAYGMLTEDDRTRGHRIAATWLEEIGGEEPSTLAEHWLLAKDNESAIPWLLRAANAAVESGDSDGALRLAARAIELGASGEALGVARAVQGHAFGRRGDFADAVAPAKDATTLLPEGSVAWWRAVATAAMCAANVSDIGTIVEVIGRVNGLTAPFEPSGPLAFAIAVLTAALLHGGQRALAVAMEQRLAGTVRASSEDDPLFEGWRAITASTRAMYADADPARGVRACSDARACFRTFQDAVGMAYVHTHRGVHLTEAGAFEKAIESAEEAIVALRAAQFGALLPWATMQRIRARVYLGVRAGAAEGLAKIAEENTAAVALAARAFSAELAFLEGNLDEAEMTAAALLGMVPPGFLVNMQVLGTLAHVALERGKFDRALELADRALALEPMSIMVAHHASVNRFVRVSALLELGRHAEAKEALADAKGRIQRLAAGFDDPTLADAFRTRLPVNAQTLALEIP